MRRVPFWLFGVTLIWAVVVTIFFAVRNPLPIPDNGHRVFAVTNNDAAIVVVKILTLAGLSERFTFTAGPTTQTLLWDNTTVIMQLRHRAAGIPPNAISVVVAKPKESAEQAALMLTNAGFSAEISHGVVPELGENLVLLKSGAFEGWGLVFRLHTLALGKPPNQRKLVE